METKWLWQTAEWPEFQWDAAVIAPVLSRVRLAQGRLLGRASAIGFDLQLPERVRVMTDEAVRTAAIEGGALEADSVRSSVARRLGLDATMKAIPREIDGLVEVLVDATTGFDRPLTLERILGWHAAIFPTGWSGMHRVSAGAFRGPGMPMQVVSGPVGHESVHYVAPPGEAVDAEMSRFLEWFNAAGSSVDGLILAAIAHLRFVTIHPFEDGNGRIARVITEMALARDQGGPERWFSMSAAVMADRDGYYQALRAASTGTADITGWILWFLDSMGTAVASAMVQIDAAVRKGLFWQKHAGAIRNDRQLKILNRMLDAWPEVFEGGMTTRKAAHLTKSSPATAQRDLADLVAAGILEPGPARGRATSYRLRD